MMGCIAKITAGASMLAVTTLANNPSPVLSISISTSKAIYPVGEPVYLKIVFSNHSETPIAVWVSPNATQAELFDEVNVSRSGTCLEPSAYEQAAQSHQMVMLSRTQYGVSAGNDAKDGMTLNKLFDLNKPGKYIVQIKCRDKGYATAAGTSNITTFEIR